MISTDSKPASWYWIVCGIALIWNLMGVMAYVAQVTMSPEALQALSDDERMLYENTPVWATSAFALAVWGGVLGSLLLLLRRKLATPVLMISLAGILVQMYHAFFMSKSIEVYGPGGMVMPAMVILIAIYLVWLSNNANRKGWMKN